jgi:hypothetical protein
MAEFKKPPPLDIKCTSVDCDNHLHCFKQLKKMTPDQRGRCRACGADLVDWQRLHRRDMIDAKHTFAALRHELIRHHFFHKPVDDTAMRHAQRKGLMLLKQAARDRLQKYLAPADPPRDGRQTSTFSSTRSCLISRTNRSRSHRVVDICRLSRSPWINDRRGQAHRHNAVRQAPAGAGDRR